MEPRKLDVLVCRFAYAGNGGYASELPCIADWVRHMDHEALNDPRIGRVGHCVISDTPITMTRNKAVRIAQEQKWDLLLMIDSDQMPDCELSQDPLGKPFWKTSFDFMYERWDKGPYVIVAPYCGPPPEESVYIFQWLTGENDSPEPSGMKLKMIPRSEATMWAGIADVAAGPTGLSLWDVRAFDLVCEPYFDYEWSDKSQSEKASTEDVYATRNISLAGITKLGYNPLMCNWDSWAGHAKPKMVRKPRIFPADKAHITLTQGILAGLRSDTQIREQGEPGVLTAELVRAAMKAEPMKVVEQHGVWPAIKSTMAEHSVGEVTLGEQVLAPTINGFTDAERAEIQAEQAANMADLRKRFEEAKQTDETSPEELKKKQAWENNRREMLSKIGMTHASNGAVAIALSPAATDTTVEEPEDHGGW